MGEEMHPYHDPRFPRVRSSAVVRELESERINAVRRMNVLMLALAQIADMRRASDMRRVAIEALEALREMP